MEVSREELAMRFRDMSDEELLSHLQSRDLTALAHEVATSVLNSRGLVSSALPGPADASADSHDGPGTLPRVQVRSDQVDQARELLAAMKRGDFQLQETTQVESSGAQSDLEATQDVFSMHALKPRGVDAPASSSAPSLSSTAVAPIAPARQGPLIRILILVVGALLTAWLWTILTH